MKKVIVTLVLGAIVLIGVVMYQRLVIVQQQSVIIDMYNFIQAGCPFSQIQ